MPSSCIWLRGEFTRCRAHGSLSIGEFLGKRIEPLVAALQHVEFGHQSDSKRRQFVCFDAMFARQFVNIAEPLIKLLQRCRIVFESFGMPAQRPGRFREQDFRLCQHAGQRAQLVVESRQFDEF